MALYRALAAATLALAILMNVSVSRADAAPPHPAPQRPIQFDPHAGRRPGTPIPVIVRAPAVVMHAPQAALRAIRVAQTEPRPPILQEAPISGSSRHLTVLLPAIAHMTEAHGRPLELHVERALPAVSIGTMPPAPDSVGVRPATSIAPARELVAYHETSPNETSGIVPALSGRQLAGSVGLPFSSAPAAATVLPRQQPVNRSVMLSANRSVPVVVHPLSVAGSNRTSIATPAARLPLSALLLRQTPAQADEGSLQADDSQPDPSTAAAPPPSGGSTDSNGSSTLSDGHAGSSTAAYLAAVAALAGLGLGLRILLSNTLHLPWLVYAPPVPPG